MDYMGNANRLVDLFFYLVINLGSFHECLTGFEYYILGILVILSHVILHLVLNALLESIKTG